MRLPSNILAYILTLSLLCVLLALINFPYGISHDEDGFSLLYNALDFDEEGYSRSRSWGNPAYELIVYPMIFYTGPTAAKLYSLIFYVGSAIFFFLTVRSRVKDRSGIAFLASLAFVLLPVSIASSNTLMETSQGLFLAILSLYFLEMFDKNRGKPQFLALATVCLGMATSTRPDYVILSVAVFAVLLFFYRPPAKILALASLIYLSFSALPFLIYGDLSIDPPASEDPIWRTSTRALFGYLALFGLPAVAILLIGAVKARILKIATFTDPFITIFVLTLILFTVRFVILPDELEYVIILPPLTFLTFASAYPNRMFFVSLVVAVALPNLMQIHFFTRNPSYDNVVEIGMSPGALYQERRTRLLNDYMREDLRLVMSNVARRYGRGDYVVGPSTREGDLVIFSEEMLRFYRKDRAGGRFWKAFETITIITYPLPRNKGWRQFLKYQEWREVTPGDFKKVTEPPG